jgi:para-aminobenzoate synthetase/4-amino-4-deoxychorismate lyase
MRAVVDFPSLLPGGPPDARVAFDSPLSVITAAQVADVVPGLARAAQYARDGMWVVGWVSYEAAPAFETAMRVRDDPAMPLLTFGVYDHFTMSPTLPPTSRVDPEPDGWWSSLSWVSDTTESGFHSAIARIHDAIRAGETYQVNYTNRLRAAVADRDHNGLMSWYDALRRSQGSGFHALIDTADFAILSASPELFFELAGARLRTRPMKGTSRRGRWLDEDERFREDLLRSSKERAENLMIVDLLRNDIGRIARTGTVEVPALFSAERYETVWQLTSQIEGVLGDDVGVVDIFRALFPCGSVTGAPKINTMQWIDALETSPRDVYCGAIGVIKPGGDCIFNVPIRTVVVDRKEGRATYGVGSGITIDSDADRELDEFRAKALLLSQSTPVFELLETMRLENGEILRLPMHLRRIKKSATYFGFGFDESAVESALRVTSTRHDDARRVRLRVSRDASFTIDASETAPPRYAGREDSRNAGAHHRVAIAAEATAGDSPFSCNKTTNRAHYDAARALHPGVFDVLLWNEQSEITEFTTGNIVLELDGALVTPDVACGLLNGVFREVLLQAGVVHARRVMHGELANATRVWLVNSLREWVEVDLERT